MSIAMKVYNFFDEYLTFIIPQKIEDNPSWDGVTITPLHVEVPELFNTVEANEEYCITPVHEETVKGPTITRAFGDLLPEELI